MPRLEVLEAAERIQQRVLHHIVGIQERACAGGQASVGPPLEPREIPAHQRFHRHSISPLCAREERQRCLQTDGQIVQPPISHRCCLSLANSAPGRQIARPGETRDIPCLALPPFRKYYSNDLSNRETERSWRVGSRAER